MPTRTVHAMKISPYVRDVLERAGATFVQVSGAALVASAYNMVVASPPVLDLGALQAVTLSAVLAGTAAALSVLKSLFARRVGDSESASLDPQAVGPATVAAWSAAAYQAYAVNKVTITNSSPNTSAGNTPMTLDEMFAPDPTKPAV